MKKPYTPEKLPIKHFYYDTNIGSDPSNAFIRLAEGKFNERIFEIGLDITKTLTEKVAELLWIQFFDREDIWSIEEGLGIFLALYRSNYSHILPGGLSQASQYRYDGDDITYLTNLKSLLCLAKHNLLTFEGITELNKRLKLELSANQIKSIKKSVVIDPALLVKTDKTNTYLFEMFGSKEIIEQKKKVLKKLGSYRAFINKVKKDNLDYIEYKKLRDFRYMVLSDSDIATPKTMNQRANELKKLLSFEYEYKFRISYETRRKIRYIRGLSANELRINMMEDLSNDLCPIYYAKVCPMIWGGLKREFIKLKRIKNKTKLLERIRVFYSRFESKYYSERIWRLLCRLTN